MTVTEQVKKVMLASGETHYRIGKEAGIDTRTLDRFIAGEQPFVRSDTLDKLCAYFGLELQPKKQTDRKQSSKRPERGGK